MKKVAVVFNGGTITMKIDERLQAAVPSLSSDEIMSKVTGIEGFAEIETYTFSNMPSPHMTPDKMLELSKYIKKLIDREDIAGAVVTHGTDTLEETAYFLDLTLNTEKPVVVTGAMRNGSELGYDGPANLSASICTVISDESRNRGVLVCMNGELNSAAEVTKANSMALNAFRTPNFGPIGMVDDNKVLFYRESLDKQYLDIDKVDSKVTLIKCTAGMDSTLIDYCIERKVDGIVIEAFGRGNIPPYMVESVKRAIDSNVAVVVVSRCFEGRVCDSYGYHGGGKELRDLGVIFGDTLPGQKARIKLMVALSKTKELNKVKDFFENGLYNI
ncbi:asparaginase [Inconstantimicrobium porci]|uniref:Asparaginase n=1 Tax=Inconstantimicrobium porci TaxID=2652291 RepID=A0A7X2T0L6_9CLOT|nr:asparaginase [Inconstantimicrobium porci]MDD6770303.1 asparaginase [Inconstantimicrobium porci]MSR90255.1 asparaginase [Inconstantimicrobium porci]